MKERRSGKWTPDLADTEKETLFAIAGDTLKWSLAGRKGKFSFDAYSLTPKLKDKCATFVTFKKGEELRGCMGCLEAVEEMYLSVHRSAANASRDDRFAGNPITGAELPQINMSVSLLSPRREIPSIDDFNIGEHGIWMEKGAAGAVFLPEVASEQKWDKETTLTHLSMKAGLSPNGWKKGAKFMVFESVVLSR